MPRNDLIERAEDGEGLVETFCLVLIPTHLQLGGTGILLRLDLPFLSYTPEIPDGWGRAQPSGSELQY